MVANGAAGAERWRTQPGEVWLNAMPLFHFAGSVINGLGALTSGATQVLCTYDPALVLALIERHRVELACLAGSMWDAATRDLSSVRLAVTGGQSIPSALVRRVEARLDAPMSILFGMTELCGTITAVAADDDAITREQTCGRPLPGVEIRVVDVTTDTVLPTNTSGEVQARGWLTMSGYFEDPGATAQTLLADGWLCTGDIGSLDEYGRLRISGRVKEMIIRGGENIYPAEIEARLREHPAVADAAVVGLPDDTYGEIVAAALVVRTDTDGQALPMPSEAELTAWCRATLAPFKTPKRWLGLPALPMTPSGKVRKHILRDTFTAAVPSQPAASPRVPPTAARGSVTAPSARSRR